MEGISYLDAAYEILSREKRPLGIDEIVSMLRPTGFQPAGEKSPSEIMKTQIYMDIKLRGEDSKFIKVRHGKIALREWGRPKKIILMRKGSLKTALYQILSAVGKPMSVEQLADSVLNRNLPQKPEMDQTAVKTKLSSDIKKLGDLSPFVQLGKNKFGLRDWELNVLRETMKAEKEKAMATIEEKRPIIGDLLDFRGLMYEPTDKNGIIFLFSKIHEDLDIKVDKIQPIFPDAKCRKKTKRGWEVVWMGFEYKSSDFKEHEHNLDECDFLVCWVDDWKDRPSALKIIGLKELVKNLKEKELKTTSPQTAGLSKP